MGKLIDMEMDDERQLDHPMPLAMERSRFPYGTRMCFCDEELKKLGLDINDVDEGDYLDLRAFATITSVHKQAGANRVEIQVEKLSVENESQESPDDEAEEK